MTQVAIVSSDSRLHDLLQPAGLKLARLDNSQWRTLTSAHAPAALVLDLRGETQLPAALSAYRRQNPASAVVLVLSSMDPRLMLDAMRAGVTECVAEPLTAGALEEAVRRVLVDGQAAPAGQLFAFVGAKGGVGTTTLAVNTAAALARVADGEVLLADLHLGHGDAAIFLGADPRFSVVDALENVHRLDDALLKSLVEQTKAGIHLLASSDRTLVSAFEPQRTRALLEFALRRYRVVVLDVPRSDMSMLDALDLASSVVVVASQEVGALKNAARMAQTLSDRYGSSRVRVIVNRFDARSDIGQTEVERAVGLPIAHMIPSDYRTAIEAVNLGRPMVMEREQGLARALRTFAGDLAGIVKKHRETPIGVLGRLAWRRA